ncbi:hypothetical protein B0H14DRAFT_812050 [Mycena olivaceomarginata]|nr:hypothetical protein B0H14DRAFT_812050 [Mycena olivaceomarginata]
MSSPRCAADAASSSIVWNADRGALVSFTFDPTSAPTCRIHHQRSTTKTGHRLRRLVSVPHGAPVRARASTGRASGGTVILSRGASTRPDAWIYSFCMCAVHQALSTHRVHALADRTPHPPAQQGLGVEKAKKCGPSTPHMTHLFLAVAGPARARCSRVGCGDGMTLSRGPPRRLAAPMSFRGGLAGPCDMHRKTSARSAYCVLGPAPAPAPAGLRSPRCRPTLCSLLSCPLRVRRLALSRVLARTRSHTSTPFRSHVPCHGSAAPRARPLASPLAIPAVFDPPSQYGPTPFHPAPAPVISCPSAAAVALRMSYGVRYRIPRARTLDLPLRLASSSHPAPTSPSTPHS